MFNRFSVLQYPNALEAARDICNSSLQYQFTELEVRALKPFFSSTHNRVFFVRNLAQEAGSALLAMYSRLKNPRGLRGLFLDSFLPQILLAYAFACSQVDDDPEEALKNRKVRNLAGLFNAFPEHYDYFEQFINLATRGNEALIAPLQGERIRKFLSMWLDSYGHNSIARMGNCWLCCEQISLLTAKTLEWEPFAGFIELSTRYVDMNGKDVYPLHLILQAAGFPKLAGQYERATEQLFTMYRELSGDNFDGPVPNWLSDTYGHLVASEDLRTGIIGETCDMLGNLLPASTLTSVACAPTGESLPRLVKYLLLDGTPENIALAEAIVAEAERANMPHFFRHVEPTEWERAYWLYLNHEPFFANTCFEELTGTYRWDQYLGLPKMQPGRGSHDRLPRFSQATRTFRGIMSFRSWRDLQRHTKLNPHFRTYLNPTLGFYKYCNLPTLPEAHTAFNTAHTHANELHERSVLHHLHPSIIEYLMPLGCNVGFIFSGSESDLEFTVWQRTKPDVHREVRQVALRLHGLNKCSMTLPWRVNSTPHYTFPRGKTHIALPQ